MEITSRCKHIVVLAVEGNVARGLPVPPEAGVSYIIPFFSDDCVLEMPRGSKPWGSRFEGKRNVREALATRFEGLPDVHYGNDEHFVDSTANTGISKWTLTGTTREGTRTEVQGCDFYTFRDGKVIRKDSYWKIVE